MNFFDRVKKTVRIKDTTIEYVVEKAGIPRSSYNTLRSRETLPRADEAVSLARVLDVTVEYLVTGEGSRALGVADGKLLDLARRYREVLSDLESMPEEGRRMAKAAIHAMANQREIVALTPERVVVVPYDRRSGDERVVPPDAKIPRKEKSQ